MFGGYDDKIHMGSSSNELLPVGLLTLGLTFSGVLIADLDGDGQVEVLAARKTGKIFGLESDGSMMTNFLIVVDGSRVYSSY